jgi:hypothetical protein
MLTLKGNLQNLLDIDSNPNQPIFLGFTGLDRQIPLDIEKSSVTPEGALVIELQPPASEQRVGPLKYMAEKEKSGCGCSGGSCGTPKQYWAYTSVTSNKQSVFLALINGKDQVPKDAIAFMTPDEAERVAFSILGHVAALRAAK